MRGAGALHPYTLICLHSVHRDVMAMMMMMMMMMMIEERTKIRTINHFVWTHCICNRNVSFMRSAYISFLLYLTLKFLYPDTQI
jgi:hypothetical protein